MGIGLNLALTADNLTTFPLQPPNLPTIIKSGTMQMQYNPCTTERQSEKQNKELCKSVGLRSCPSKRNWRILNPVIDVHVPLRAARYPGCVWLHTHWLAVDKIDKRTLYGCVQLPNTALVGVLAPVVIITGANSYWCYYLAFYRRQSSPQCCHSGCFGLS